MQRLKVIFQFFLIIVFITMIVFVQGHYNGLKENLKFSSIKINIDDSSSLGFINKSDILNKLSSFKMKKGVTPMKDVPLRAIEKAFKGNQYINNIEAYYDITGTVNINITQFIPQIRIIDSDGQSYFVDSKYKVVPQRNYINLPLPVVTQSDGVVPVKYLTKLNPKDSLTKRQKLAYKRIDFLIDFVEKLEDDDVWKNFISQININSAEDIELIPRIGAHLITLCSIDSLVNSEKYLDKMSKFYKNQSNNGVWTEYSKISFKYDGQVVCKKIK